MKKPFTNYANRGAKLELMVDMTNNLLLNKRVADIRKVPTPIKILNIKGSRVTGALEKPSWVDYAGVLEGRSLIFDAKETTLKRFPLKNLQEHQYELLKSWHLNGAYAFILVAFWTSKNEPDVYIVPFDVLKGAWDGMYTGGSKSISMQQFKDDCIKVSSGNGYPLDYIKAIREDVRWLNSRIK